MQKKKLLVKLMHLIGIALFIWVVLRIGPEKIINNFRELNPLFYLVSLFIILPVIAIKVVKWNYLLKCFKKRYGIKEGIKVWLIASYAGVITPGRLGDFLRAYYAKKNLNLDFGKSIATVFVDRIMDVGCLFIMAFIGIVAIGLQFKFPPELIYGTAGFFVVFLIAVFVLTRKNLIRKIASPFFNALVPYEHAAKIRGSFEDFYKGLNIMKKNKQNLATSFAITVVSWYIIFCSYYILGFAFGLNIDLVFLFSILPIVILLETLPISFAGVGVRDVSLAFFFGLKGIPAATAVAFSISVLSMNIIVAAVGLILSQKEKEIEKISKGRKK